MSQRRGSMITVDHIVAKYRSLSSEAHFIRDLKKSGLSDKVIRASLACRRKLRGHDPKKHEEQVRRYREHLLTQSRIEQLGSYLFLFSSEERIGALYFATAGEPLEIFWPVFLRWWKACDDTWSWRSVILDTLKQRTTQAPASKYYGDEDHALNGQLPDMVRVYRGCSRPRVRGLSWTLDRKIAEGFAYGHRCMPTALPVIAEAIVPQAAIFRSSGWSWRKRSSAQSAAPATTADP
jgi:hypothetical protein